MSHGSLLNLRANAALSWGWILFILFGIICHAIGIGRPFLGHFAQHQTDYATVVQRWLEAGLNPLEPAMRFLALGKNRLFFGDLPLNMIAVTLFCQVTHASIELAGRGLSFLYFLASLFPVFRIARLVFGKNKLALVVLLFYIFSPLTLIYSQLFLLEMSALCFALWAWYFFLLWWQKTVTTVSGDSHKAVISSEARFATRLRTNPSNLFGGQSQRSSRPSAGGQGARDDGLWLILSAVFWALCFMTRIYFVLLLIPLFVLFVAHYKARLLSAGGFYLFFLVALLPPVVWQAYAAVMAAGAGDQSSLLDNLRVFVTHDKEIVRTALTPAQYMPVLKTLTFKIATPLGLIFYFFMLCFHEPKRRKWIFFLTGTWISFFVLFIIAPRKFVEFEYYFMPFVPVFCFGAAFFFEFLMDRKLIGRWGMTAVLGGLVLMGLRFSMPSVLTVPSEDRCVLKMAEEVRRVSSPESRVIAFHGGSSSFLYYTDRDGWGFSLDDTVRPVRNQADSVGSAIERLERFRSQGAAYFALANSGTAVTNPSLFEYLNKNYKLIYRSDCGLIYSLEIRP